MASLKNLVVEMEVQRAGSGRAGLYAGEMTEAVDRALALLQKKFKRSYRTSAPIELVAYYVSQPPPTREGWLGEVTSFITSHLDSAPFRRGWLFDHFSHTIPLVWPPYTAGQGRVQ